MPAKFTEDYYVTAYELARSGYSDKRIAQALGTNGNTLGRWRTKHPALDAAIKRGRLVSTGGEGVATFRDYVYKRLPENLQALWTEIQACEDEPNALTRLQTMFANQGLRVRQHLFLHALTARNFNVSEACRLTGIARRTFEAWVSSDADFADLVDEINQCKKDFFESALVRLVQAGEPSVVIFANKTYNRDRGYNEKLDVSVNGTVNHLHAVVPAEAVLPKMPLDARRALLQAVRGIAGPANPDDVIDAEYEEIL